MLTVSFKWVEQGEKFKTPAGKFIKTENLLTEDGEAGGNAIALDDGGLCFMELDQKVKVYRKKKK